MSGCALHVGRRYWAAQLDALARGWEIQRIFIYDTWSGDLDSLAGEHKSAGVRVKRILTELPSGLLVDVTTWGNTHVYEQRVRVEGTTTLDRFSVNEVDIRRCVTCSAGSTISQRPSNAQIPAAWVTARRVRTRARCCR